MTFEDLFRSMQSDPDALAAAKKSGAVVQFRLLAPASFVVLDLSQDPFTVDSNEREAPDIELMMTEAAAREVLSGRLPPAQAAATGAVRAKGGILKLLALQPFLAVARDTYLRNG